ncbi:BlaI/MecI/CopY family transcriptional regulator (plasmid) [Paenibacillus urinalis]|uniref:BlaI/MecI/CopY family transcriptional regulator n=1 Tax=Paenibacillus urinalis TaxID=521520 RepID=A0AAX3N996_9BACL|nr:MULTISPECIES: BlaI/MecI/CopY family transcriptional regulator [Paenibacillus]MCM3131123.1 BlaI/MecI/CopY family transcriptional regulator [Paenibacillus sp. MER 78]WDH85335.1 BlaI/MecI/CopY family transcriptional regulator [Paenibacillus urinalis]WDH95225.1 BlaI/MecI/CopY family transcriptional regulator [Paenibacillus urinalis]WDI05298.1 BlaI/MecI/CopY family transcriptional regulator [Paenibacillus urinalis]
MRVKRFHLDEEGINKFFGSLEAKIMEILWSNGKMTIKQVHELINAESPISLNAVMTVMTRLTDKEYLIKESSGRGRTRLTYFSAPTTKEEFIQEQTQAVTNGLIADFGSYMVRNLIDSLDKADPDLIQQLENKLKELKNE